MNGTLCVLFSGLRGGDFGGMAGEDETGTARLSRSRSEKGRTPLLQCA